MNPEMEKDMKRLETMLDRVVREDETFQQRIVEGDDVRILDLACGACDEAKALTKFFAGLKGEGKLPERRRKKRVKLTGMDIRAREIADAAARFKKQRDEKRDAEIDFEFLHGDATKVNEHRELGDGFDVIFLRHQNLWHGKRTWEEIFHKALEKLAPEGRLIITSYFDREHEQALEVFREQGGELIATEANEGSRKLVTPGKSIDRHVAILKRQD